jgi:hypothetical protein
VRATCANEIVETFVETFRDLFENRDHLGALNSCGRRRDRSMGAADAESKGSHRPSEVTALCLRAFGPGLPGRQVLWSVESDDVVGLPGLVVELNSGAINADTAREGSILDRLNPVRIRHLRWFGGTEVVLRWQETLRRGHELGRRRRLDVLEGPKKRSPSFSAAARSASSTAWAYTARVSRGSAWPSRVWAVLTSTPDATS